MRKQHLIIATVLLWVLCLTGCGKNDGTKTKVVLTTGFAKNEVFRIDRDSCTVPEIMVYLTNMQNQFESMFGREILNKELEGATLENNIKETVLARIAQIKAMNLLAKQHSVTLTEKEQGLVENAAQEYYTSLNETEIEAMGVNAETIRGLYQEYALANKVYHYIIKDINPEISDDEARTITVQQILIKTYKLNGRGEKAALSDKEKEAAYQRAVSIEQMAKSGTTFEQLIEQYSEDKVGTYSFGKGEMDTAFEKAAFELGNDEISDVIESEYGYHIIKCMNTFDKEETDVNKVKIVEQRKKEVFNQEYDEFLSTLTKNLNEKLWAKITVIHDENVTTKNFFEIYDRIFTGQD